jgi:hypothetical protein
VPGLVNHSHAATGNFAEQFVFAENSLANAEFRLDSGPGNIAMSLVLGGCGRSSRKIDRGQISGVDVRTPGFVRFLWGSDF